MESEKFTCFLFKLSCFLMPNVEPFLRKQDSSISHKYKRKRELSDHHPHRFCSLRCWNTEGDQDSSVMMSSGHPAYSPVVGPGRGKIIKRCVSFHNTWLALS